MTIFLSLKRYLILFFCNMCMYMHVCVYFLPCLYVYTPGALFRTSNSTSEEPYELIYGDGVSRFEMLKRY